MKAKELEVYLAIEIKRTPVPKCSKKALFEYSVKKWTYQELINEIHKNPKQNVVDMLDGFIKKMDDYLCMSTTERQKTEFIVAHDTAELVRDLII